jgi:hypothetical protein
MTGGMAGEPPAPIKRDIGARALLHRHAVVLQHEIAKKVPHQQQCHKAQGGGNEHSEVDSDFLYTHHSLLRNTN